MTTQTPREVLETLFERLADPERRDSATELFTETATIRRPGACFDGPNAPEAYVSAGDSRYRTIAKDVQRWIETDDEAVSIGTLYGVTADGEEFEGVRYVDIATVEDGRISRLEIWNDIEVDGVV